MTEADWDELVTAALIGTQRRTASGGPDQLLDRAAVATAARRAGRLPLTAAPPAPAGPDTEQPVSARAAARLAAMLGTAGPTGYRPELIPEWLAAARDRGKRPPDQLLPALLGRAAAIRELRPLLNTPRARWLARLNPGSWAFPELTVTPEDDTPWRLGTSDERRAYLAAVRATDPASGRELLEDAWRKATAAERAVLLSALAENLSPDDEPLLERALDDRAQEVRANAIPLLARIPRSRFASRMAERALAAVTVGNGQITVTPPAQATRDGIGGPRDERVLTLLSRTQLGVWDAGVVAARMGGWAPVLITGWTRAAIAQRDTRWMNALLARLLGSTDPAAARLAGQLARHADPSGYAVPGNDDDIPPMISSVLRTLRFRHDMLEELDD